MLLTPGDAESVTPEAPRDARVIFLVGELDLSFTGRLRAMLDEALASSDQVRVNVSGLRTLDSSGIRELLRSQALAAQAGKTFGLIAATPNVRRLLEAADAADLLHDLAPDPGEHRSLVPAPAPTAMPRDCRPAPLRRADRGG